MIRVAKMLTAAEILEQVELLFQDPSKRTQGASARAADGHATMSTQENAVCWCLVGAVSKCSSLVNDFSSREWSKAIRLLNQAAGMPCVTFNDTHDHADVMRVIADARELSVTDETSSESS